MSVSDGEKRFITNCVSHGQRIDGRENLEFRQIHIQRNVVSQATGSSRIRFGNTDIYVGIKLDIGEPSQEQPDCGRIEFFVDYIPCGAQDIEEEEAEVMGHELADALSQIWKTNRRSKRGSVDAGDDSCYDVNLGGGLNLQDLCILEARSCFVIYIDVAVLSVDGNVLGAISFGILAAIHQLPIPHVEVSFQQGSGDDTPEIEIDDEKCTFLDTSLCPVIISVGCIDEQLVVDMSAAEEASSKHSIYTGVSKDGVISGFTSSLKTSVIPERLQEMMELAKSTGIAVHESLDRFLNTVEMDVE